VLVVVTGANGFVGSRLCTALAGRGATVRAVVRRAGTAPVVAGVLEQVGDFTDPGLAAAVLDGAGAAVTTVHPMGSDAPVQRAIGVEGTTTFVRAAAAAGLERFVHVSTAGRVRPLPGSRRRRRVLPAGRRRRRRLPRHPSATPTSPSTPSTG
jgi:nucleoside-diphosphate-sugar epimerase